MVKKAIFLVIVVTILLGIFPISTKAQAICANSYGCGPCLVALTCGDTGVCGDTCFYGKINACILFECQFCWKDIVKPSCDNYCSGNTWYHGGTASCIYGGWSCGYSATTCPPQGCCDATCSATSGCGLQPSDYNCLAKDNTVGKCDTSCTCYWPACASNFDCVTGYCCGSTTAGGPGGAIEGKCISKGYISGAYLCDPPEWDVTEVGGPKNQNIFELILNFFSQLFRQR